MERMEIESSNISSTKVVQYVSNPLYMCAPFVILCSYSQIDQYVCHTFCLSINLTPVTVISKTFSEPGEQTIIFEFVVESKKVASSYYLNDSLLLMYELKVLETNHDQSS